MQDPIQTPTFSYSISLLFFYLEWFLAFTALHAVDMFEEHRSVGWYKVLQFESDCFPVNRCGANILGQKCFTNPAQCSIPGGMLSFGFFIGGVKFDHWVQVFIYYKVIFYSLSNEGVICRRHLDTVCQQSFTQWWQHPLIILFWINYYRAGQQLANSTKWGFCFSPGEPIKHLPPEVDRLRHKKRRMIWVAKELETLRKRDLSPNISVTILWGILTN